MKSNRKLLVSFVLIMVLAWASPGLAVEAGKINLNTATVKELTQLKRIGTKYAERIVQFREENGPFKTPEEIVRVPGIGTKTFELNKDRIVVEEEIPKGTE